MKKFLSLEILLIVSSAIFYISAALFFEPEQYIHFRQSSNNDIIINKIKINNFTYIDNKSILVESSSLYHTDDNFWMKKGLICLILNLIHINHIFLKFFYWK
jgi:hypothetical protein